MKIKDFKNAVFVLAFLCLIEEVNYNIMGKSGRLTLGKRKLSFSSLLRDPQQLRTPVSYDNSFIKLDEERKLNTRKYNEQMKKNSLKVGIRKT